MALGDMKNLNYLYQMGNTFSIGMIFITVFYWIIVSSFDTNLLSQNKAQLYNTSILYYAFYISMYFIPMMNRLTLYGFMPFICTLSIGINTLKGKNKKVAIIAVSLFVVFLGNAMLNNITKDYRFVPYSSYIQYFGREKPSYYERSIYNHVHSPYKDKDDKVIEYRN